MFIPMLKFTFKNFKFLVKDVHGTTIYLKFPRVPNYIVTIRVQSPHFMKFKFAFENYLVNFQSYKEREMLLRLCQRSLLVR